MTGKFGPVSLSELMFYTSRAAFAAGCSYGVAEDVASVAAWLAKRGVDPTCPLAQAFDAMVAGTSCKELQKSQTEGQIRLSAKTGSVASAIYAGVAAHDQLALVKGDENRKLIVVNTDSPRLAEAFVKALDTAVLSTEITATGHINDPKAGDLTIAAGQVVQLATAQPPAIDDHHNILVSRSGWQRILEYFNNSLVPATGESRLSGAGAGLVDTD